MSETGVLERITNVMKATFRIPPGYMVNRATTSADVDGWDSLSHALFMMAIEQEFGFELPLERMYELPDIGALLDLLTECANARGQA